MTQLKRNKKTGEFGIIQDGKLIPVKVQQNKKTGEFRYSTDGINWQNGSIKQQEQTKQQGYSVQDMKDELFGKAPYELPFKEERQAIGRGIVQGMGNLPSSLGNLASFAMGNDPNYFTQHGTELANYLGMPQPQTNAQKVLTSAAEFGTETLPTALLGGGLTVASKGLQSLPKVSKGLSKVGGWLSDNIGLGVLTGAGAGAGMQGAQNLGASPEIQMLAGLAGGLGTGTVGMTANRMGNLATSFTESARRAKTSEYLSQAMKDPEQAKKILEEAISNGNIQTGDILQGSVPTLSQLVQDPSISALENTLSDKGAFGQTIKDRYNAQALQRQKAFDSLTDGNVGRLQAGTMLREQFDNAYEQARQQTGQAYRNVDPKGTANFSIEQLQGLFSETLKNISERSLPSEIKNIMLDLKDYIDEGIALDYPRIQDIRTDLGDLIREASRGTVKPKIGRLATIMQKQLDDFMEHSGQLDYEALQQAKQARISQGQRFEQGAVEPLTRSGKKTGAEAIADSDIINLFTHQGAKGEENILQLLSAIDNKEVRSIILDKFIEDGLIKAKNQQSINTYKFYDYINKNKNSIDNLDPNMRTRLQNPLEQSSGSMPPSFYSDEKINLLNNMLADQARASNASNLSKSSNSHTAQILNTIDEIESFLDVQGISNQGYIERALNTLAGQSTKGTREEVMKNLVQATLDPEYALDLLKNPTGKQQKASRIGINTGDFYPQQIQSGVYDPFAQMLKKYGVATANTQARTPLQIETKEE